MPVSSCFTVTDEGYEYVLTLAVIALALAIVGPGSVSVDAALGLDESLTGAIGAGHIRARCACSSRPAGKSSGDVPFPMRHLRKSRNLEPVHSSQICPRRSRRREITCTNWRFSPLVLLATGPWVEWDSVTTKVVFGTPEFDGKTIRVLGGRLVVQTEDGVRDHEISTVREAVEFLGHEYETEWYGDFHDPLNPINPDEALSVDPEATHALGQWFAFAWMILEDLRARGLEDDDPSQVQLWPEHFDAATELGDQEKGQRASFGASPGDGAHPEPYLYVAAWGEIDRSNPYWNDESFNGASLTYKELRASEDPVQTALDFLLEGYRVLHGG